MTKMLIPLLVVILLVLAVVVIAIIRAPDQSPGAKMVRVVDERHSALIVHLNETSVLLSNIETARLSELGHRIIRYLERDATERQKFHRFSVDDLQKLRHQGDALLLEVLGAHAGLGQFGFLQPEVERAIRRHLNSGTLS